MIDVHFPGGMAVTAEIEGFSIKTDQPEDSGGAGEAPSPFDLFLASLATCAGYFALQFCRQRDIATEGMRLRVEAHKGESKKLDRVRLLLQLPPEFPEKYQRAVIKAMDQCSVKRVLEDPPEFETILE